MKARTLSQKARNAKSNRESAERRRCPKCRRKSAVVSSSDEEAGITIAWCRWKCGWEQVA